MRNILMKITAIVCLSFVLFACANSPRVQSELAQGERYFKGRLYKNALHQLLPLAADGNAKAQYAVGYMYYYGYGVTMDKDTGYFWIQRAAAQHYQPAIEALVVIKKNK